MLSGIGPIDELKNLGIEVNQNLSVGKNLQDHVTIDGLIIKLNKEVSTLVDFEQMKTDSLEYLKTHDNIISAMGTVSAGAFIQTSFEKIPDYPDIQFGFDGINITVGTNLST